jgi:hypothetical protein
MSRYEGFHVRVAAFTFLNFLQSSFTRLLRQRSFGINSPELCRQRPFKRNKIGVTPLGRVVERLNLPEELTKRQRD